MVLLQTLMLWEPLSSINPSVEFHFRAPIEAQLFYAKLKLVVGRGGGASGGAVAFCPSRLGSIPGTDLLGFFFSSVLLLIYSCWALVFF